MKADKMDVILIIVGCAVALFTVVMILLYIFTGGIPDTLCQCFYTLCGGECGFMAMIKSFKTMAVKRAWQDEDRKNGVKAVTDYSEDEINETIVE
ncbi:MAG: hypothetical protein IKI93_17585 [Clostridia bacterium]|nr:hypothetical protein [Clostridia bacterium]